MADESVVIDETKQGNYKESNVTGSKYRRACSVRINNPADNKPSLYIEEQDCIRLEDEVIYRPAGGLYTELDIANPLHLAIYEKIYELYVMLREARDNG
jgi:hypothetical protein